jgi:hypothetical protein
MGITVPSSTPIILAADTITGEYYQKYLMSNTEGVALGDATHPVQVAMPVSGYSSVVGVYQGTFVPTGGVHISDLTGTDFTELVDGQIATARLNNRRAIFTVSDGQVTTLNTSATNNYHDIVVTSGSFSPASSFQPAYSEFFQYTSQNNTRYIYVPLSKSGWKRSSIYVKHSFVNANTGAAGDLQAVFYADFGQLDDDFPICISVISGILNQPASKAFVCYTTSGSANEIYLSQLDSPLAGVIIAISPTTQVNGTYEIYVSKSA